MERSTVGRTDAGRQPGTLSRRKFLQIVGATSGSAAALNVMMAWGQQEIGGQSTPPALDGNGNGTKVIVLGAGPGGCVAAYELMQLGYDVTILEARDRVGGHVFTVRGGSKSAEYGKGEQVCDWPEGFWWDAGPSRIPYLHRAFFHYCKVFNIPLADYNNLNLNAWVYAENIEGNLNGKRMRLKEMQADMAGYTSQYLATALDQEALDEPLSAEDVELLRNYLINWGLLDRQDITYHGTSRRGYIHIPDTQSPGEYGDPNPIEDLAPYAAAILQAEGGYLAAVPSSTWQSTLVQPVEGIGQLYEQGFQPAFGERLKLNCEVTEIRQSEEGVRIVYLNKATGQPEEVTGEYAVCNIPLSVLIKIPSDFSPQFRDATRAVPYAMSLRLGLGFKRRFWEEDDWIYGGQSFTNIPELGILGYPNTGYNAQGGAMLGMYNFDTEAARVSSLSYEERVQLALEHGSKVHPQMRDEFISGFSVAWHLEPYSLGAWPEYNSRTRTDAMPILQEPDGRVYLVGEHLSYVNSWIEGANQAAWLQVERLHQRVMQG
jgi:monoamine oxidase